MIQMDVNDDESVARGIRLILEQEKHLDVVVNNAGINLAGRLKMRLLTKPSRSSRPISLACARLQGGFAHHAATGRGYIINISSIAGRAAAPYQGLYSAAKFAVEGLSEALRFEVRHFGIKVAMIEPGDSRTPTTEHRIKIFRTPAYAEYYDNAIAAYEHDEKNGYSPEKIGPLIEQIFQSPNPACATCAVWCSKRPGDAQEFCASPALRMGLGETLQVLRDSADREFVMLLV